MKEKIRNFCIVINLFSIPMIGFAHESIKPNYQYKPPILTTTAIIEIYDKDEFQGIVLIERGKAPWGKAIPGGKVEYGETVENAVRREMMEEVNLELSDLIQFHVYSDPSRDFRHHSVEVAHIAKAFSLPKAGDDAAKAFLVKLDNIPWDELAFDHAQILQDYLDWKNGLKVSLVNIDNAHATLEQYFKNFEILSKKEAWSEILAEGLGALKAAKKLKRAWDEAKIYAQLTSTTFYQGNYEQALEFASKCHLLSGEFRDLSLFCRALYLESAIYRALAGNSDNQSLQQEYFAKAVKIAQNALALYQSNRLDNEDLKGKIYFNLGAAYADNPIGDLNQAAQSYLLSLCSFEKTENIEDQARTQIRLGKLYLLQKNYEGTKRALSYVRSFNTSKRVSMHTDYLEAQLLYEKGNIKEASIIAIMGLKKAKYLGASQDEARFNKLLFQIGEIHE